MNDRILQPLSHRFRDVLRMILGVALSMVAGALVWWLWGWDETIFDGRLMFTTVMVSMIVLCWLL